MGKHAAVDDRPTRSPPRWRSAADRVLRGSRGELDALFDLKSWKRAVKGLGTTEPSPAGLPIALAPRARSPA